MRILTAPVRAGLFVAGFSLGLVADVTTEASRALVRCSK